MLYKLDMASPSGRGSAIFALSIVGLMAIISLTIATDHIVGANRGWQIPADAGPSANLNYTNWAANHTFVLGDSLTFRYERDKHSVFQVNYSTYVNCTISIYYGHNWIYNWSNRVGRVVVPLNKTQTYYFVCGSDGHCQQGMKVAINVTNPKTNKTSTTTTKKSESSGGNSSAFITGMVLMAAFLYTTVSLLL